MFLPTFATVYFSTAHPKKTASNILEAASSVFNTIDQWAPQHLTNQMQGALNN
jgi:hypothetical protein